MRMTFACIAAFGLLFGSAGCDDKKPEPKNEKVEASKNEDPKKAEAPKEEPKDEPKKAEAPKGEPKDEPKDEPKGEAPKAAEAPKEAPGDTPAKTVAELGKPAPDFELKDLDGKAHKLSDFKGKTVVLEWYNPDCPFVVHAHGEGPLKGMAPRHMEKDTVWLSINSGAPGKQGHGIERNKKSVEEYGMKNPILIDESGKVGQLYGAKTTPHIFVIDKEGKLVYRGALDNAPLGRKKGEYAFYSENALTDVAGGKDVSVPDTKPWGCSVKYAF